MNDFRKTTQTFRAGSRTPDGAYYCSDGQFAAEQDRIFGRHWICVGREEEAPAAGDWFRCEVAGESLIVLRGRDGALRAFYNFCRHRGTRLCAEAWGTAPGRLQCPYHGWTYDLGGRLVVAPLMDEVADFAREDHGLHRAALETCQGLVFVSLADDPPSFAERVCGPLARMEPWSLAALRSARRIDYQVEANWKLLVENYSECYHCPLVHPLFNAQVRYRSGHNDAFEGPLLGGYMDFAEGVRSLTPGGAPLGPPLGRVEGPDLARAYFYALFPSLTISLHPDYVMLFLLQPLSPDRTMVRCEWLFDAHALAEGSCRPDEAVGFWDLTNREDWQVCAAVQQGVHSRRYGPSFMSSTESLPEAFNRQVMAALRS